MHETIKPRRKRVPPPWAWAAAALLAAVLLGASALHFVTASCAAVLPQDVLSQDGTPSATTTTEGQAYYYNPGGGEGSCSFGPLPAGGLYVSLAPPQYANGASCGGYLEVSGPAGKVQAEIVDQCPGCTDGGLDMSQAAFARVASPAAGTADVSYRLVRDPRPTGPLAVRFAQSASGGWLALQVIGNGNPVSSVAVAPDLPAGAAGPGRWQRLTLDSDDYWAAPAGAGLGPFLVRITDIFGHRVTLPGIKLRPGSVQHTHVLMYATASRQSSASTTRRSQPPATAPATTAPATVSPATVSPGGQSPATLVSPALPAALGGHPGASGTAGPHC
jgi:expansin